MRSDVGGGIITAVEGGLTDRRHNIGCREAESGVPKKDEDVRIVRVGLLHNMSVLHL